jgi:hypothetical protein
LRQPLRRRDGRRPPAIGGQPIRTPARRLAACAGALWLTVTACPGASAEDISALYEASWAGLPAAHIRLTFHRSGDSYRTEIAVVSEGMPHLVSRFRGTAIAEGKLIAGGWPAPARYEADYDLRKRRDRKLRMLFIARSGAVIAERGPDDTARKRILAEEFRRNVVDPLSTLAAIQAALRRGETSFTVPVYDGARRFDTIVKVLPRDPNGPGIRLAMTLKAIAGFKGESSDEGDPDDAPRPASLTLSDDAQLLPRAMSVAIWYLPLDVALVRTCATAAECAW